MAEGCEPYHVPQQSRRDKLRVFNIPLHNHNQSVDPNLQAGCTGLLPLYDPTLLPPDLLTCATNSAFHPPSLQLLSPFDAIKQNSSFTVKEEGVDLMGFVGGITTSTPPSLYNNMMQRQGSLAINPIPIPLATAISVHDIDSHPFFYAAQNIDFNGELELLHNNKTQLHHQSNPVAATGQGLSLSLSSQQSHNPSGNNLPLELNLQRYIGEAARCSVPLGPFTGYALILKGSRLLKPAQQLLEEICDVGHEIYAEKMVPDSSLLNPLSESLTDSAFPDDSVSCSDGESIKSDNKKSPKTQSADEMAAGQVYRRYKQYYQQVQTVIASFESVAGLSNAAPFTNLAFKTMSKHFKFLTNAITEQLQSMSKVPCNLSSRKDGNPRSSDGIDRGSIYAQRPLQNSGIIDHQPAWRPQRGLPERAVSVLRAWLFEHFLHPYPTDTDKVMLAKQTGLSRSQVSNWFINARVRLWKPMVEEIHTLETRQAQNASQSSGLDAHQANDHVSSSNPFKPSLPSTSTLENQDPPPFKDNLPGLPEVADRPINLPYGHISWHHWWKQWCFFDTGAPPPEQRERFAEALPDDHGPKIWPAEWW
ncbi:hypothetical protein Nepgr_028367 [Nepenthes gracilis]|uniref:Homeobox domain-containing protein n=1 Tax=Nepenthes gracilis TaxID=150966 RepID=A0AAD3TCQ5_NEPGR|nr:hypothetical protein Nepgr_028367 [Nepenthes gracilis]